MKKALILLMMMLALTSLVVAMGSKDAAPAAAAAPAAPVPTLTLDYQVNAVAADVANNYLTFKGPVASATKDQYDATSGASKLESTLVLNYYRNDIFGKKILPGGLRGLFLYPIASHEQMTDDAFGVVKNADGSIRIRYIHRGTANELTTDKTGKLVFPGVTVQARKIGFIAGAGPQVISAEFSADGTAATVDWAKVWDAKIAGGKVIGTSTQKTGDITPDAATSDLIGYEGALQLTFDGIILKMAGVLNILRK